MITWSSLKNGARTPIHGETFIAMVEFTGGRARATGLTTYGESSQPGSKHNGDQLQLLSEKRLRPFWRSHEELKGNTE